MHYGPIMHVCSYGYWYYLIQPCVWCQFYYASRVGDSICMSFPQGAIDDDTCITECLNQHQLLDECQLKALEHLQDYQNSLLNNYNKNALSHTFKIGDLVLYEKQRNVNAPHNRNETFGPNWLGIYTFTFVYGSSAYDLSSMDGRLFKGPIKHALALILCVEFLHVP